ncbi:putative enzyme related to lactoylglutathione lyase [Frondihabitans sp. PhB188]|nr:putative enzyme related to lactoylglutathione lyase [Frondihabitans sp. PhB188]
MRAGSDPASPHTRAQAQHIAEVLLGHDREMQMAHGVATVWVPVTDMKRAVAFYRDTLGLDVKSESDDWSELDAGGLMIGLNGREDASVSSSGGAVITFQPDGTIEDELAEIASRGADIQGEISDHEWGRIVPFKDSEGNDLQFYTPPQG